MWLSDERLTYSGVPGIKHDNLKNNVGPALYSMGSGT